MDAQKVWNDVTGGVAGSDCWWIRIEEAYKSSERHYHDLHHLERKLTLLYEVSGNATSKRAFIFSIFFQYFEYDPRKGDCAKRNVQHFKNFAEEVCLESSIVDEVEMLLAMEESGPDQALLQDLDMAALAVTHEEYVDLTQKLRKEYAFLSDEAYKNLRKKILQSFLLIPNIFSTEEFRNKFESQARSNIENEVAKLEKS